MKDVLTEQRLVMVFMKVGTNTLKYCYDNKIDFNNKKNKLLITYCNLTHPSRKNIKSILDNNNSFVEFAQN